MPLPTPTAKLVGTQILPSGRAPRFGYPTGHERVMLHLDLHRRLGELTQHAVGELNVGERPPGRRFREFQKLADEPWEVRVPN